MIMGNVTNRYRIDFMGSISMGIFLCNQRYLCMKLIMAHGIPNVPSGGIWHQWYKKNDKNCQLLKRPK